jgi:hypothetical protein
MARAIGKLGFYVFEEGELQDVSKVLKEAKLDETLKVVHLGRAKVVLPRDRLETSYYAVVLDNDICLNSCKSSDCIEKCVEERKSAVMRAIMEVSPNVHQKEEGLDKVLEKVRQLT